MPTPTDLLAQLQQTADAFTPVALAWHLAVIAALACLDFGVWRPRAPDAVWLAGGPVVSAAMIAFASGNLFNAIVLGAIVIALGALAGQLPERTLTPAAPGWRLLGLGAVGYALAYPHFVTIAAWSDLGLVPTGVLPCPSLALTVGFGLLGNGFGSRAWSWLAATAAALYGVFGVVRLGVWLDLGLVAAAVALAARAATLRAALGDAPRPGQHLPA